MRERGILSEGTFVSQILPSPCLISANKCFAQIGQKATGNSLCLLPITVLLGEGFMPGKLLARDAYRPKCFLSTDQSKIYS